MNRNLTSVITINKKDDEVLDENMDSDAAEDGDIELEENTVIDMEEGNNKAEKILLLIFQNTKNMMKFLIIWLFIQLKTMN